MVVKHGWLEPYFTDKTDAKHVLSTMNPEYAAIIRDVPRLMMVDFSSLLEPHLDFADQIEIQKERVWKMTACAVHYDLDLGLVSRFLGGEYSAAWRDVDAILTAVQPHISCTDFEHIERILRIGCPAAFHWEEPADNK